MDAKMKDNNGVLLFSLLSVKYLPILVVLLLLSTMTTVQCEFHEEPKDPSGGPTSALIEPLLKFTSKLYGSNLGKENVVFSPISIHKALNLVLLGTDQSTQTERELIDTLGYTGKSPSEIMELHQEYSQIMAKFKQITQNSQEVYKNRKGEDSPYRQGSNPPILDLFNMVITKNKGEVQADYSNKAQKYYNSSIVELDSNKPETERNLLKRTDDWSKEAEFDSPILTPTDLDRDFPAMLLSAVRVQAYWPEQFHESDGKKIFHQYGLANQTVNGKWLELHDVHGSRYLELTTWDKASYKMLHTRLSSSPSGKQFSELSSLNCQVIQLPLEGDLSFTIIEPLFPSGSGGELQKLANQLFSSPESASSPQSSSTTRLTQVLSLLDGKDNGDISGIGFPKFRFDSAINLKPILQSLGLNKAFDGYHAEISNLTVDKLFIDDIKHRAVIDVNKSGIKAAGVTIVRFALLSAIVYEEPIYIRVENPFIFMLRYKSIPLFIGQVVKLD